MHHQTHSFGKMGEPQESLEKRLFGTTKKKLAWAAGTAGLVVSGIVIWLLVSKSGSGTQENVGLQVDNKRVNIHTASGRPQSGARKPKVRPDGSPIPESSTSSSESTTEEEVGETPNNTAGLEGMGKKNKGKETKAKSTRKSNSRTDSIRSQPDQPDQGKDYTETERPSIPLKPRKTTADGFKTSKTNFLTKARSAFLDPAAKVDQLKSQFGLVVQKLDDVKKTSDAGFEDPDDPKIVADSKFDGYMGSYFVKIVDELIPEFDTKFTELCAAGDAKALETLFNHWLSWVAKSKVNLAGKTSPEWIKCKSVAKVRKCFAKTNPNILTPGERFNALLNSLKDEGIITVDVPNTAAEQTSEAIAIIIINLEERGHNDKAKEVMEEFKNANAGDAKKVEMVTKIVTTQSAVKETLKFIKDDSKINSFFESDNPKALKQIEEAKTIEQLLDSINSTFTLSSASMKTPSSVLVKAFSSYLKAKGESETVLNALQAIQDSLGADKAEFLSVEEKMQQANAWTEVIVNIGEESDLRILTELVAKSDHGEYCLMSSSGYPHFILGNSNQEFVEILRISAKEQTNSLAKAKNLKEYLQILSQIDLSHCPCSLRKYIHALSYLHGLSGDIASGLAALKYLDNYDNSSDKTVLLKELLGKRLERVAKVPKDNDSWYHVPSGLRSFANHFEEVGDKKEAEEWRTFALEADIIFSLGLPNEAKYERIFSEYKGLKKAEVTEAGLSNFVDLLSNLEPEFQNGAKFLLAFMVKSESNDVVQMILKTGPALKNDHQVAKNLIRCKNFVDRRQFSYGKHLYFQLPFLIGVLDDDVVQYLCMNHHQHPISIPSNMGFKKTAEYQNFVNKQTEFFGKIHYLSDDKNEALKTLIDEKLDKLASPPDFAPNIGFMDWRILQNCQPYGAELIDAYEALASIMDAYADPGLARKMKEHAAQVKEDCKKLS